MRMAMGPVAVVSRSSLRRLMEGAAWSSSSSASAVPRYFSTDGKGGRVLSEEERAAENIYIQIGNEAYRISPRICVGPSFGFWSWKTTLKAGQNMHQDKAIDTASVVERKMEREKMEKMKKRAETETAEKAKESADKKPEGESHKG